MTEQSREAIYFKDEEDGPPEGWGSGEKWCRWESPSGRGICAARPAKFFVSCLEDRCWDHRPAALDGLD
jgi:hypothetical protein